MDSFPTLCGGRREHTNPGGLATGPFRKEVIHDAKPFTDFIDNTPNLSKTRTLSCRTLLLFRAS